MGCDIHIWAEVRENEYSPWQAVGEIFENPWYDPTKPIEGYNKKLTDHPYNGRNYELFSLLADVRNNGYITPIVSPRGVPEDASNKYKAEVEKWGIDGHSHSWLGLDELLQYDWNTDVPFEGVVPEEEYLRLTEVSDIPESYCGSVFGRDIITMISKEYDIRNQYHLLDPTKQYFVRMHWTEPATNVDKFFVNKTIPALAKLGSPENVRIVFFFDN